ncbi:transcriptional regulator, GntR family protein [Streptomyces bingchenggensis BCW-1]|uniref:Transcriptional regulator, GntR family protein n=1 Tax=Streptomyces bingchenggensis (strain BCW-1) TaxID=749414 RepID=D7CG58_STRBB|nr:MULTISPECIES: SCO5717 family growth-regulating ATPase [Streptomyces]ADI08962.1 transcriptional regulator, GntR family protein [Streptomyces bingchenggensis BCW-1]
MSLPNNDPRPPYQLAANRLRAEITSGHLKPGDRLPSSRELRDTLGIANATVHAALRVLRDEGLIYSVHGRGNYVADPKQHPTVDPIGELASEWAGEFTLDYTPPAWYTQYKESAQADHVKAGPPPPVTVDQTASLAEILLGVREQLRHVTGEVVSLRQQIAGLEEKVSRLENPDVN